jgi:hypothetical protein
VRSQFRTTREVSCEPVENYPESEIVSPSRPKSKKAKIARAAKEPKKSNKAGAPRATRQASSKQGGGSASRELDGAVKTLHALSTELTSACGTAQSILAQLKELIGWLRLQIILPPFDGTTVVNPPKTFTPEVPLGITLQFTDKNAFDTFESAIVVFEEGLLPLTWNNFDLKSSNSGLMQLSFTVVPTLIPLVDSAARPRGDGRHRHIIGTGTGTVIYTSGSFGRSYASPAGFLLTPAQTR